MKFHPFLILEKDYTQIIYTYTLHQIGSIIIELPLLYPKRWKSWQYEEITLNVPLKKL
jgi:hypothetical protein